MTLTRRRVWAAPIGVMLALLVLVSACGGSPEVRGDGGRQVGGRVSGPASNSASGPVDASDTSVSVVEDPTSTLAPLAPAAFESTDVLLRNRVNSAGLSGGIVIVVRAGERVHSYSVGATTGSTPMSVASSTKWLTAATLMTFVDAGSIGLDDPIGRWLPEFASDAASITARQLLSHTSGVRDQDCLWNGVPLDTCVRLIARSPREFSAGSSYSYGNADFHVLGRLIEELGGADFATVVGDRLTGPLGMTSTTWPGAPESAGPAAGVRTTVDDYLRFLAMVLYSGESDGRRVLSPAAVEELIRNQIAGYDTSHDFAVGITRIPRYGLGCWPDVADADGRTVVVSGNGGKGFYPWVDFSTQSFGVIGVQDDRGAQVAVPASQLVAEEALKVLRR